MNQIPAEHAATAATTAAAPPPVHPAIHTTQAATTAPEAAAPPPSATTRRATRKTRDAWIDAMIDEKHGWSDIEQLDRWAAACGVHETIVDEVVSLFGQSGVDDEKRPD